MHSPSAPAAADLTLEDMDFQLNPDAAEFVPVSPAPSLPNRALDLPISGSPFKHTPTMDDIRVPSPTEFQEEVSHRPSEITEKPESPSMNGIHEELQKPNLDVSEVSSTRAEFGDESTVSFLGSDYPRTQFDGSFTSSCSAFDDPMTMSFGPGDLNPLLSPPVDLNAVHDLTDADLDDNEVQQELADLISPESDAPRQSEAFPDSQVEEMFGGERELVERIDEVS